jgi:hypothetical protein
LIRVLGDELGESVVLELDRVAKLVSVVPAERRSRSGSLRAVAPKRRPTPAPRLAKAASLLRRSPTPRPATLPGFARSAPPSPGVSGAPVSNAALQERAHAPTIPAGRRTPPASAAAPSSAPYPRGTASAFGLGGAELGPASVRELPFVLVATLDTNLVSKLAAWLDPRAAVLRVRNAASLLHDLENAAGARSVIVLDCVQPSLRPVALAALAEDLPATTRIVLWGATTEIEAQVRALAMVPSVTRWIVVPSTALPKEVAARCAELVC